MNDINEKDKLFACFGKGCDITFTDEDHLNWHAKKHDMMLNLGLTNKCNEVADQTPTPTRFIRNCEEVGLFQDLQNVNPDINPFDEIFKKAIETTKSGGTLEVLGNISDDTLHTPQIYPQVEENQSKFISRNDANSNDFTLSNVLPTPESQNINETPESEVIFISHHENESTDKENDNEILIGNKNNIDCRENNASEIPESQSDSDIACKRTNTVVVAAVNKNNKKEYLETNEDLKKRIKEALKSKKVGNINLIPLHKLKPVNPEPPPTSKPPNHNNPVLDPIAKLRESNRAAQWRCRTRKRRKWTSMEEEIASLKEENKKLRFLNSDLKKNVKELQEILLKYTQHKQGENASSSQNTPATTVTTPQQKSFSALITSTSQSKLKPTRDIKTTKPIPIAPKKILTSRVTSSLSANNCQVQQNPPPVVIIVSPAPTLPVVPQGVQIYNQPQPAITVNSVNVPKTINKKTRSSKIVPKCTKLKI